MVRTKGWFPRKKFEGVKEKEEIVFDLPFVTNWSKLVARKLKYKIWIKKKLPWRPQLAKGNGQTM